MESVKHSATAFFNSYIIESKNTALTHFGNSEAFLIPLSNGQLIIPLNRFSKLGRHEFTGRFMLKTNEAVESIPFDMAAKLVIESTGGNNDLHRRVQESAENIEAILKDRGNEILSVFKEETTFIKAEQALFAGHTFHPSPKNRDGFSLIDSKLYAPESGNSFPLRWFFVHEDILFSKASPSFKNENWTTDLFREEFPQIDIPENYFPFVMHPWQASRSLLHSDLIEYVKAGKIHEINDAGPDWKATSSLRTLYRENSKWMCKFSLDVKLTNSVRHMLTRELDRGLQVYEVMKSEKGSEFLNQYTDFEVMYEPVYSALIDQSGEPIKETFVMGRMNTLKTSNYLNVAFLTQNHPTFGSNYIQKEIFTYASETKSNVQDAAVLWLERFLEKAIRPFIAAESIYGILLGAHQQNLLLRIENHLPAGSVFRDCHGTGYSPRGYVTFRNLGILSEENGNILPYEEGNHLFSYYLIHNTLFNVMAAIASGNLVSEDRLIQKTRLYFEELLNSEFKDSWCLRTLLSKEKLLHKGNFLCSVKNVNENTTSDPLSIYVEIKNPFFIPGKSYE